MNLSPVNCVIICLDIALRMQMDPSPGDTKMKTAVLRWEIKDRVNLSESLFTVFFILINEIGRIS